MQCVHSRDKVADTHSGSQTINFLPTTFLLDANLASISRIYYDGSHTINLKNKTSNSSCKMNITSTDFHALGNILLLGYMFENLTNSLHGDTSSKNMNCNRNANSEVIGFVQAYFQSGPQLSYINFVYLNFSVHRSRDLLQLHIRHESGLYSGSYDSRDVLRTLQNERRMPALYVSHQHEFTYHAEGNHWTRSRGPRRDFWTGTLQLM